MNKKISVLFFGLAIGLCALWGVLELILYEPKTTGDLACEELPDFRFSLKDENLLRAQSRTFWSYAPGLETLNEYRIASEPGNDLLQLQRKFPLRCQTPDYNCIATQANAGPVLLKPFLMRTSSLLVAVETSGHRKIVPALIDGEKIKFSTSLKICGKIPLADPANYITLPGVVGYWDSSSGLFGLWKISSYNGTLNHEAAREPDLIYSLTPSGLEPSPCTEKQSSARGDVFQMADRFLFFANIGDASLLKSYTFDGGLAPGDEITQLKMSHIQNIWPLDDSSVAVKTSSSSSPLRLVWNAYEANWSLLPLPTEIAKPLNQFSALNAQTQLHLSSSYLLARQQGVITLRDRSFRLASSERKWRRSEIGPSSLFETTENRFFWVQQADENLELRVFRCPWNLKSDKD